MVRFVAGDVSAAAFNAVAVEDLWTAQEGRSCETTLLLYVETFETGRGYDSSFWTPRVGGGWAQVPVPRVKMHDLSMQCKAMRGSVYIETPVGWCKWSPGGAWTMAREPGEPEMPSWVLSCRPPAPFEFHGSDPDQLRADHIVWDRQRCYMAVLEGEWMYGGKRFYLLRRGDRAWIRLRDPPEYWQHPTGEVILLPNNRVLCQFSVGCDRTQLWIHSLEGNRWDKIENPCHSEFTDVVAYGQGFLIYPALMSTKGHPKADAHPIDPHFYYGTVSRESDRVVATYADLSTPALAIARASGFPIARSRVGGGGIVHSLPGLLPHRNINFKVLTPFGF